MKLAFVFPGQGSQAVGMGQQLAENFASAKAVLDEVDAPLDDTNVARFCDLLREIANKTGTRFLVITHHRMTMARMDRLFGVTMEQRGISKLVSVDLQTAERIRDVAVA